MPIDTICSTANTAVSSITPNTSGRSATFNSSSKSYIVDDTKRSKCSTKSSFRKHRRKRDKSAIFREKKSENELSLASRIMVKGGLKALCFANPVNDGINEIDDMSSLCQTIDTADDTTVSNYFTDTQLSSVTENHPPMPLFNHFKVECNESSDNTIMSILVSGSHHSTTVRHLFVNEPKNKVKITSNELPKAILLDSHTSVFSKFKNTSKSKSTLPRNPLKKFNRDSIPPPMQRISGSHSHSTSMSNCRID